MASTLKPTSRAVAWHPLYRHQNVMMGLVMRMPAKLARAAPKIAARAPIRIVGVGATAVVWTVKRLAGESFY